jgi:hypothetical protein
MLVRPVRRAAGDAGPAREPVVLLPVVPPQQRMNRCITSVG